MRVALPNFAGEQDLPAVSMDLRKRMPNIILIRPGSTEFDSQGRIQGQLDIPLSPDGEQELADVREFLRSREIEGIYSSPSGSALQTGQLLSEWLDVKCKPVEKLQNLNQGLWEGMLIEDVRRKHPKVFRQWQEHPDSVCPPDGEMLEGARDRVRAAVSKLVKKHKQGDILLVVPEPLASVVECMLGESEQVDFANPGACGSWESFDVASETLLQRL